MADASDALIIVDLQNDFCAGGTLAVPGGEELAKPLNELMKSFPWIVTTQDWHPADHCSFTTQNGPWPPHCIQNTWGAALHPDLQIERVAVKILKGRNREHDAYSGFQGTPLTEELRARQIRRVYVAGLATDYCVKHTVLDALQSGFEAFLVTDLVRAVNLHVLDGVKALNKVKQAGGRLIKASEVNPVAAS